MPRNCTSCDSVPDGATRCRCVPAREGRSPIRQTQDYPRSARDGCHATWRLNSNATHCLVCHQTFGSSPLADQHNDYGEGRCMNGERMGLVADVNKWGTTVWRRSIATPPREAQP